MEQEPIINHGTLIDTFNYREIIRSQANSVSYMITNSRPSKRFVPKTKKQTMRVRSRKLKK